MSEPAINLNSITADVPVVASSTEPGTTDQATPGTARPGARPYQGPPRPEPRGSGPPRRPGGDRPFPRSERPKNDGKPPEQLDRKDFVTAKPNKRLLDAQIEAEMAAAMDGMDVAGMLAPENQEKPVAAATAAALPGGRKRGVVVAIRGKDVFIDVPGGRSQGMLPRDQFDQPPVIGDEIDFTVERYDSANGLLILTREGAVQSVTDMSSLQMHMIVEAKVTGVNKTGTGLMIEVNGIRGFMPISQIDLYRVEQADQFVGQRLKCEVIELDRIERNLIVSRRALLERERAQLKEAFWAKVEVGQTHTGIVSSLQKFGVFVNLGACDGLIPMSELSWSRVADPAEIVKVGQRVDVVIHRLDRETRKIALSLKQLHGNPWDDFTRNNKPGARISGRVTRIADFGAFVEVAPGIEGLIHITELSTNRVRRVTDVVQEGQPVEVQVLTLDPQQRRISLSLKTIMAGEEAVAAAATEAEKMADIQAANDRAAARPVNPNLRGGIGSAKPLFGGDAPGE